MSKKLDEAYLEALDKITELNQQLAEKDKLIQQYESGELIPKQVAEKSFEMRDKLLAEKDKEINRLQQQIKELINGKL